MADDRDFNIKYYETEVKTWWGKHHNEVYLWAAIAAFLIGISIYYVKCTPDAPVKGIIKPDVIIKKEVQYILDDHTVDSLQNALVQITKAKNALVQDLKFAQARNKYLADLMPVADEPGRARVTNDYINEIKEAASNSDSACNIMINTLEIESNLKDSIISKQQFNQQSILKSFNEIAYNSTLKDDAIKKLNRSLRWQKVQKIAIGGVAAILLFKLLSK